MPYPVEDAEVPPAPYVRNARACPCGRLRLQRRRCRTNFRVSLSRTCRSCCRPGPTSRGPRMERCSWYRGCSNHNTRRWMGYAPRKTRNRPCCRNRSEPPSSNTSGLTNLARTRTRTRCSQRRPTWGTFPCRAGHSGSQRHRHRCRVTASRTLYVLH